MNPRSAVLNRPARARRAGAGRPMPRRRGGALWRGPGRALFGLGLLCLCLAVRGADSYSCRFVRGGWEAEVWTLVKSPRWDRLGGWVQEDDAIRNEVPADAGPADLLGPRAGETYSSMVVSRPFEGNLTVRTTLLFEDRMAPLIVLAPELGADAAGRPEYREHFEIVAYDKGVNVWHHTWADGKPAWKKTAYWVFDVKPGVRHRLEVQVNHSGRGPMLVVRLDDREMGYREEALPARCYVGITGCEGVNRFYDFTVRSD